MSIPGCAGLIIFQNVLKPDSTFNVGRPLLVFSDMKKVLQVIIIRACFFFYYLFWNVFLFSSSGEEQEERFSFTMFSSLLRFSSEHFRSVFCMISCPHGVAKCKDSVSAPRVSAVLVTSTSARYTHLSFLCFRPISCL